MTHQAHSEGHGRTFVIDCVAMIRGAQGDDLLVQSGTEKLTYAGKAAIAGLLNAHAKRDTALIQDGRQPPAGIAPIEQQEIVGPVFVSEDAREGAAAFAEKRAPNWKGK